MPPRGEKFGVEFGGSSLAARRDLSTKTRRPRPRRCRNPPNEALEPRSWRPRSWRPRSWRPRSWRPRSRRPRSWRPRSWRPRSLPPSSKNRRHSSRAIRILAESVDVLHLGEGGPGEYHAEVVVVVVVAVPDDARFVVARYRYPRLWSPSSSVSRPELDATRSRRRHARIFLNCLEQSGTSACLPVWLTTRCAQRENSAAASGHTTLPCGIAWKHSEFRRSCCRDEIAQVTRSRAFLKMMGCQQSASRRARRDDGARRRSDALERVRESDIGTERSPLAHLAEVEVLREPVAHLLGVCDDALLRALSRVAHRIAAVRRSLLRRDRRGNQPSIERGTDTRDAPSRDARVVLEKSSRTGLGARSLRSRRVARSRRGVGTDASWAPLFLEANLR